MAALRVELESRPRYPLRHEPRRGEGDHLVLAARQHQGRDRDLAEPIGDEGGRVERGAQLTDEPLRVEGCGWNPGSTVKASEWTLFAGLSWSARSAKKSAHCPCSASASHCAMRQVMTESDVVSEATEASTSRATRSG